MLVLGVRGKKWWSRDGAVSGSDEERADIVVYSSVYYTGWVLQQMCQVDKIDKLLTYERVLTCIHPQNMSTITNIQTCPLSRR